MADWDGRAQAIRMARDCGAFWARHLSRVLTRVYDEALRPHGVSLAQLEILASAAARGEVAIGQIADDTGAERSTVSRNVRSMVAAGLLDAARTDTGRTRHVSLTHQGRTTFTQAYATWAATHDETAAVLGADGVTQLQQWVARLEASG